MTGYLVRRLLLLIPTLIGITFITFLIVKSIPGDPVLGMVGERADHETIERIKKELGTERPFVSQYIGYMGLIIKGEMGRSYYTNQKVNEAILEKFPNTLKLALGAIIISSITGILLGIFTAVKRGTFLDRLGSFLAIGGISLPVFWIGLILMLIFGLYLKLLPPSGMGEGNLIYLVLPASTLAIPSGAYIARITRSMMFDVLSQPYIATARAKGLKDLSIIFRHALKNALIPIVTIIGLDFGSYLNGAVLTETIFGWDGLGRYAMDGILKRDYPVIMGAVLVGTVVFVIINLIVDISYAYLDPRIRVKGKS
jgi:ABC-type dipeptide/oligopeptide/nickel transport system permease component